MRRGAQKVRAETAAKLGQFARNMEQNGARSPNSPPKQASSPITPAETVEDAGPSTQDIMAAIASCQSSITATLTTKIDEVKVEISLLKHDVQAIRERTGALEERVSILEDRTAPVNGDIVQLQKQLKQAADKLEDMENRQRRSNIRVVGLPERSEGANPETFAEQWLRELLGPETFSSQFVAERAHRVPTKPLPPGAPPRPFLIKLLNYRDRDAALRAARQQGDLQYNGARVSLYPDYSAALQRQRSSFLGVKRRLRDLGIKYSMIFPAKLRIIDGDRPQFFERPEGALHWLETRPSRQRQSPRPEQAGPPSPGKSPLH